VLNLRQHASFFRSGLLSVVLAISLAGCASSKFGFPYRAGVQQGNWLTKEQVALLRTGMTREQVKFALGTPSLASVLHSNRWDYPYYYRDGSGKVEERIFTVFFTDNMLSKWEGADQPELQPFQIAIDEVKRSQQETAKLKLDAERSGDGSLMQPIQVAPGITAGEVLGDSYSDPAALPGAPMDAPQPLE
jgi:outer membrane protein assembly factor BamE